jgi:hypothetical protein
MEALFKFDVEAHGKQWQFMWFVLLDAMATGLNVGSLFLPFVHPPEMLAMETGAYETDPVLAKARTDFYNNKRLEQLAMIVSAVIAYAASLGIDPEWVANRDWTI